MKRIQITLLTLSFIVSFCALSQTTEFEGTVKLGPTARVFKIITVPGCPKVYTPPVGTNGTTVTYETKFTNDKTEITVTDNVNRGPITINTDKEIKIPITPNSDGKANIYVDEKDKSKIYLNYWLNPENVVKKDSRIEEYSMSFDCNSVPTLTLTNTRTLTEDETFSLYKVEPTSTDRTTTWFLNSDQIRVYNAAGTLEYYLVNRYDRAGKYVLDLKNREHIVYKAPSLSLSALTIPFKYRFGFTRNGVEVKDDVVAGINIGAFAGYKLTGYSLINKAGTFMNRSLFAIRFGPFINFSSATLDTITTTAGKIPMKKDDKQNIAVLSPGLGFMGDFKGLQIGVYLGWDFGLGSDANNWNYNGRSWLGLGIGYKITDLFKQKE